MKIDEVTRLRRYHAHVWDEPLIMEMSHKGRRGFALPQVDDEISKRTGTDQDYVPKNMLRSDAPKLPELSQPHVLRHYLRLSQQTLGMAMNIDLGMGTCTMKYSPPVDEELVRLGKCSEVHPFQDESTVQGILEITYKLARFLGEISGMDEFTFQPGGGGHGIYTNACIIRKYHDMRGELGQRDEVITTVFSHPADAASPATAGFKVLTIYPNNETGLPDMEAMKSAVSKHTAGLMITNPEDTGIFNPQIDEYVKLVHEVGGICAYDQANSNALFGIARAREAGFDLCHFNLHKAFSSPHGSNGPACGAVGATSSLSELLPIPVVSFDGSSYHLDFDRPHSIGKIRQFYGNFGVLLRAYAWIMSMGTEGLMEVSKISILNANYLIRKMSGIRGVNMAYPKQEKRLDQARFTLEKLKEDTGFGTSDIARRAIDFGVQEYFTSHHPWVVPEPFLPEPCETYSKDDIEYWISIIKRVCEEAYTNPDIVQTAPHNQAIARIKEEDLNEPKKYALTWRGYLKKYAKEK